MPADAASLAREIRRRIGPPPLDSDPPLVSIVVLNRDGAGMLRRLLGGLAERTDYPRFELILIDNGSSDDSLDFIRRVVAPFPISIVANPHNESFSDACNQGAELASGELLLFLNNDIEPFEPGWLRELVSCRRRTGAGAVSATLVCPDEEHQASFAYGYGIQHRGLAFSEEGGMIHPILNGWEDDPLDEHLGEDREHRAVAAACVLVERGAYEQVGGFTHGYVYGAEDIDLCLKLRAAGLDILCSGRSVAIHHPVSTRRTAPFEEERARKLANRRVLWERWGPRLRREYEVDRPGSDGGWPLSFCIKVADPHTAGGLAKVAELLCRRGHPCRLFEGDRAEADETLNYDVAVHMGGRIRYVPKPAQTNVLWDVEPSGAVSGIEDRRYAFVLSGCNEPERFVDRLLSAVGGSGCLSR